MLDLEIGENPLTLIENLSVKKAFKDLLKETENQ